MHTESYFATNCRILTQTFVLVFNPHYLKSEVQLTKRASHFGDEMVHAFTFLECDDDVRRAFFRRHFGHYVMQWKQFRQLLHDFIKCSLDLHSNLTVEYKTMGKKANKKLSYRCR